MMLIIHCASDYDNVQVQLAGEERTGCFAFVVF